MMCVNPWFKLKLISKCRWYGLCYSAVVCICANKTKREKQKKGKRKSSSHTQPGVDRLAANV